MSAGALQIWHVFCSVVLILWAVVGAFVFSSFVFSSLSLEGFLPDHKTAQYPQTFVLVFAWVLRHASHLLDQSQDVLY